MQHVDFLPVEYRQQHLQRQSRPWQLIAVAAFAALVGAAAVLQHQRRTRLEQVLAEVEPQYESIMRQDQELGETQTRLKTAESSAQLLTYLRSPWPRTQILAALLDALPEPVTLQQLQIANELLSNQREPETRPRAERKTDETRQKRLAPAAQDLKQLRDESDRQRTVVHLSGIAQQSEALHEYLESIGKNSLFSKVDLESLENVPGAGGGVHFSATLRVRPGYSQPDGPAPQKLAGPPLCQRSRMSQSEFVSASPLSARPVPDHAGIRKTVGEPSHGR